MGNILVAMGLSHTIVNTLFHSKKEYRKLLTESMITLKGKVTDQVKCYKYKISAHISDAIHQHLVS